MRDRKFFFLNIILLTLIFVTLSFPALGFSSDVSPAGDSRMMFVHRDTTIKDSFQPDVFVVFFIVAVSLLFPLLLFLLNRAKRSPASPLFEIADILPRKQREILQQEALALDEEYEEAKRLGKKLRAKVIVVAYYSGIGWSVVVWISDKFNEIVRRG